MRYLILILALLAACGTGDEDKSNTPSCSIVGNNNAVNCNNDGDSSIDQDNSVQEADESTAGAFLWKPESERDGTLVVLVEEEGASVLVTGNISEALQNTGPSNGYGTTARGAFSGCDYGENIAVEIFKAGDLIDSLIVPDGCERFER